MLKSELFRDLVISTCLPSYFVDPLAPANVVVWKMKEPCLKIDHCDSLAIEWRWTGPGGNKWMKRCPILLGSNFLTQTFWYIIIFQKILSYLFFIFFNSLKFISRFLPIFADFSGFSGISDHFTLWKLSNRRFWNSKWTCLR